MESRGRAARINREAVDPADSILAEKGGLGNPRSVDFSYYSPIKIRYFNGNRRALRVGASHKNPTRRWRYQNKTIVLF